MVTAARADYFSEHSFVAVPADSGSRPILGDQRLLKFAGVHFGERCGEASQRQQKLRYRGSLLDCATRVIVFPAERDYAALAEIAVKLELAKWQLAHIR